MERVASLFNYFSLEKLRDYFILAKPRVVYLVVFTAFTAMVMAFEKVRYIELMSASAALICITMGSCGAGMINMWYDSDIDSVMSRTKARPIPQGRIDGNEVLVAGVSLSIFSVVLMYFAVNVVASALLGFAILYYALIYTVLLKRVTAQNIVIGGAAGSFPPMIGWAAITGGIALESVILFLIIFFWTPPHFWSLALKYSKDYEAAGIPMLPVVSGIKTTKVQIALYAIVLAFIAILPYFLGFTGVFYLFASVILNAVFVYYSFAVYRDESQSMKMFFFSVIYLFALFSSMIIEKIFAISF